MAAIRVLEALPPEPAELADEKYWNKWVAIGRTGLVGADTRLSALLDDLEARGVDGNAVTTLFNTPPTDSIVIPTPYLSSGQ